MASMSNYLENKIIDWLLRGQSFSPPSTLYVALLTATPTDASTGSTITEVSGGNYARQSIASLATNWKSTQGDTSSASSGTGGTTSNVNAISWTGVTWSGTVTSIAICDALTSGNVLFWGDVTTPQTVASGNSVTLAVGDLSIQIDN